MKGTGSLKNLIDEFKRLPGIGAKTAERLAFFILKSDKERAGSLARALLAVKEKVKLCYICSNITEREICSICEDNNRERDIICVVEEPKDIYAIERTKVFRGKYHVLMGALSPLEGIGPSDLKIEELTVRVRNEGIIEVIVATNPNTEGEATAMYISKLLKPLGIKVTRIARGLPVGSNLEFTDEVTLMKSLQGRLEI